LREGKEGKMRRAVLLWLTVMGALVLLASGIALAAVVNCVPGVPCMGTDQADQITGTSGPDEIFAEGGDDTVRAGAGNDGITGDGDLAANDGEDTIFAGPGDDEFGAFGRSDTLRGGSGNDTIHAALDGVKDDINCGKGSSDRVDFDSGIDVVAANCEIQMPR
jgi:Ca2+-binding RTX toxin-like protein